MQLGTSGRFAEAQAIQGRILRADFLGMKHGVRALKAGLNLLGYEATVPRKPIPPLTDVETAELKAAFVEAGLLPQA